MNMPTLATVKRYGLKWHKAVGAVLALPLALTTVTGILFTYFHDYTHQKSLAKACLHWHTLEVFHLEKLYPLVLGVSLLSVLLSALVLWFKPTKNA
ncbi:MAG: peptidase [Vampirovibrionales bacterium]